MLALALAAGTACAVPGRGGEPRGGERAGDPAPGPVSDLRVMRIDPEAAPPGGTTTVHAYVANEGPDRTASAFTVLVTLPPGTRAEGPFFPRSCQVSHDERHVRCEFPAGLPPLRSATALVPVRIGADVRAPGTLTGGSITVLGPDDPDFSDNRQPFDLPVVLT
ncbi:hypothetical protein [Kitasatospora sp. NPDC057223]|uniref:hypothetical protein n=1 Tax=Kitasatospora sp. NPDC057223 TaxID=3346055 RepID=UPI003631F244